MRIHLRLRRDHLGNFSIKKLRHRDPASLGDETASPWRRRWVLKSGHNLDPTTTYYNWPSNSKLDLWLHKTFAFERIEHLLRALRGSSQLLTGCGTDGLSSLHTDPVQSISKRITGLPSCTWFERRRLETRCPRDLLLGATDVLAMTDNPTTSQTRHSSNIGIRRRRARPIQTLSRNSRTEAEKNRHLDRKEGDEDLYRSLHQGSQIGHNGIRRGSFAKLRSTSNSSMLWSEQEPHEDPGNGSYHLSGTDSGNSECGSEPILLMSPDVDILPVVKTQQARASFEFYVKSYTTSITEVSPQNIPLYSHVIHQILHDELLFMAFTTCSEAARWRSQTLYADAPVSVVKGYGKTIALLSRKLQSENFAMSPSILLAMSQLVAIETLTKNTSATARHLAGMQAALQRKGQNASPNGASAVSDAVNIFTRYFMCLAMVRPRTSKTDLPTYPRHPFDPKMSMQIADLPAGFAEIALSGRLSTAMLDLLENFNGYFRKMNPSRGDGEINSEERTQAILLQVAYCIDHHQIQKQSIIERLILTALTAYAVRRDRIHPALINVRNYFQITCAYLDNLISASKDSLDHRDQGSDLVMWAGLLLLLTSTPEAHARKLALKLLPRRPEPLKLHKKCQDFFWDDDLTNALLSGEVLMMTATSNDIIAENVRQTLADAEPEMPEEN